MPQQGAKHAAAPHPTAQRHCANRLPRRQKSGLAMSNCVPERPPDDDRHIKSIAQETCSPFTPVDRMAARNARRQRGNDSEGVLLRPGKPHKGRRIPSEPPPRRPPGPT